MSWVEFKKINSDITTPLDELIHVSSYRQALLSNINRDSTEWALYMLDTNRIVGHVLDEISRANSSTLRGCRTFAELAQSTAALNAVLNAPNLVATLRMVQSPYVWGIIKSYPVAISGITDFFARNTAYYDYLFAVPAVLDILAGIPTFWSSVFASSAGATAASNNQEAFAIIIAAPALMNAVVKSAYQYPFCNSPYFNVTANRTVALATCTNNPAYFTRKAMAALTGTSTVNRSTLLTGSWGTATIATASYDQGIYFWNNVTTTGTAATFQAYARNGPSAVNAVNLLINADLSAAGSKANLAAWGMGGYMQLSYTTITAVTTSATTYGVLFSAV